MEYFKNHISAHWMALIFALTTAVVVFLPSFLYPLLADSYQGINVGNFGIDEFHYLSMGKEPLESHGLGNPFLREGKEWFNPEQKYTPYLVLPFKWLGLADTVGIVAISTLYGFMGVVILTLLIYSFALQLSGDKHLSIISALFVVLGYNFLTNYLPFYHVNLYARPLIPLSSAVVFFLYLNLLLKSLRHDNRKYTLAAGAVFGLSFYIYFYLWTFLLVLSGILFLLYFFKKDTSQYKKVFTLTALGLLFGAAELALLYLFSQTNTGQQILLYGGGSETRVFTLVKLSWLALVFFLLYWYWHPKEPHWPMMLALILSGIVAINQGVITGREFQRFHYFWYFIIPTVTVIAAYMTGNIIQSPSVKRTFYYFLLVILLVNGATQSYLGTLSTLSLKNYMQRYAPIIEYLKKQPPSVILASDQFNEPLFVIYTNHDLFWQHQATVYNTSIHTFRDALFVYMYLNKESRTDFLEYVGNTNALVNEYKINEYQDMYAALKKYYTATRLSGEQLSPEDFERKVSADYRAVTQNQDGIKDILKKHQVTYVVWDENKNPEWDLSVITGLTELMSNHGIHLYAVRY